VCTTSTSQGGLNIAAIGSTSTTVPFTMRNPAGMFIHAFAVVTNAADAAPLITIGNPLSQCARALKRSQPYRYNPMKIASTKNAKPSSENGSPMMPPA
jgi:hypothetical protein